MITIKTNKANPPLVAIVMGSSSDYPVMKGAIEMLEKFGIPYEADVVSAHRTPKKMYDFASNAAKHGIQVIIAGAGGSAHLPGMIASITTLPVIGVPVESKSMRGIDSLYSIVQMPSGIPVSTMAINGAKNAGIAAASIIALNNSEVAKRLANYKNELIEHVNNMSKDIKS